MAAPIAFARSSYTLPGCDDVRVDFACQRRKILDPADSCEEVYCAGTRPPSYSGEIINLNVFGVRISLTSERAIAQIVFLGFSAFLGIVALTITAIGVYASFKRANAESDDDIQYSTRIIRNAVIGLIIIVLSLVIVQFVASILGLGSITELADFNNLLPGV